MYTASAINSKLNYVLPKAPRDHVLKHNGKSGSGDVCSTRPSPKGVVV